MDVRGRDLLTGLPKTVKITSYESWLAMQEPLAAVIEGVKKVLEITPPELAADIVNNGIVMTGGGSLLDGLIYFFPKKPIYLFISLKIPYPV